MATDLPNTIDYTAKDFAGLQAALFAYAAIEMPSWTARQTGDFGVLMVDLMCYIGDILSYYEDRIAAEAYLATATQTTNVLLLAQLLGYTPSPALAASGTVTLISDPSTLSPIVLPAGTQVISGFQAALDAPIIFELTTQTTVPSAGGTVTAAVTEGADQGTYALAVTVGALAGTSVLAIDLGQSTGAAGQTFTVPTYPVLGGTLAILVQLPAGAMEWTTTGTLLDAAATDTVYTTFVADTGQVTVIFGDGVNGLIPPAGVMISASYKKGGGAYGNLAANSILDMSANITGVSVNSSSAMTGGADAESTVSIRTNAPRAWRTQSRIVTTQDAADSALTLPAVYKASAVAGVAGSVTVYVMAAQNTIPTSTLLSQVQAYLTPLMMAGTSVTVTAGSTVAVNLGTSASPCQLYVQPTYSRAATVTAVQQAVQALFAPDNTDFGEIIPLSAVYAAIDAVPGVSLVNIPIYARADLPQTGTFDALFRAWEVPVPGTFYLNATGGI